MEGLVRLVYASRARFADAEENALSANVSRIVMQSRKNNPARGLVGALLFADGCFFQILEGPTAEVDALYQKLHLDSRHSDLKVLRRAAVSELSFGRWSMKYVPRANEIRTFLSQYGLSRFDPYQFDAQVLDGSIKLLIDGPDAAIGNVAEREVTRGATEKLDTSAIPFSQDARNLAIVAIVIATLALLVALLK
jgi:hypothetical protein